MTTDTGTTTVHYGPGNQPLCGEEGELVTHTPDPQAVKGCPECLELVAEDLADHNDYRGHCLHCRAEITALGGVAWRRAVRNPCRAAGHRRGDQPALATYRRRVKISE